MADTPQGKSITADKPTWPFGAGAGSTSILAGVAGKHMDSPGYYCGGLCAAVFCFWSGQLPVLSSAGFGISEKTVAHIKQAVQGVKRAGDIVVVSIHWGGNRGYAIPSAQTRFAHKLIDAAGVDIIHGHSSHHVKGIEICKDKPIIYGCGDFLTDYEGISGQEGYRGDLA